MLKAFQKLSQNAPRLRAAAENAATKLKAGADKHHKECKGAFLGSLGTMTLGLGAFAPPSGSADSRRRFGL